MAKAIKVTVEKTLRPAHEGGGFAYGVFTHAMRGGNPVKVGVERSSIYADMVALASKRAKALKVSCECCSA